MVVRTASAAVDVPVMKVPAARSARTRDVILCAAERLYAESGVAAVSNRHVSEASGQGNNAAVAYHFGTKADLVRAIVVKHSTRIEDLRSQRLSRATDPHDLRSWLTCLIRPSTDYLATLGSPTWFARFNAQVLTDPEMRGIAMDVARSQSSLMAVVSGVSDCVREIPVDVRENRFEMARMLMTYIPARHELTMAEGRHPSDVDTWDLCGTRLIDALVGMWQASVTG
ncbi:TetR/AcrR family transcriptional regulator [Rhodococcus sp. 15-649-1-2]|nr:TetR/AcrR family transcriptional regulator [Rhodococcus sp. 06-418-1B]OZE80191.1 TetR/AcrR family transcriptional regulator [Rhodococcus sp. 15-649-1-2]